MARTILDLSAVVVGFLLMGTGCAKAIGWCLRRQAELDQGHGRSFSHRALMEWERLIRFMMTGR